MAPTRSTLLSRTLSVSARLTYAARSRASLRLGGIGDQVALGRCLPRPPADPYVPTLEHTVPLIMGSLREVEAWIALRGQEQAGNVGATHRTSANASSGCCCGD